MPPADASLEALDNTQVAIGTVAERPQCLLVTRTVMRGNGLRQACKLNEYRALIEPILVGACRQPAREKAAARRLKRRGGELGVRSESLRIAYRTVRADPICGGHGFYLCPPKTLSVLTVPIIRNGANRRQDGGPHDAAPRQLAFGLTAWLATPARLTKTSTAAPTSVQIVAFINAEWWPTGARV